MATQCQGTTALLLPTRQYSPTKAQLQRQRCRLGKHYPRPSWRRSRSVWTRLRRTSWRPPMYPPDPAGVPMGVADLRVISPTSYQTAPPRVVGRRGARSHEGWVEDGLQCRCSTCRRDVPDVPPRRSPNTRRAGRGAWPPRQERLRRASVVISFEPGEDWRWCYVGRIRDRRKVPPPSGGPTQVGTTLYVVFRALLSEEHVELGVAL
jgi:hypothetical protein